MWPLHFRAAVAPVPVPLRHPDPDIVLDLSTALQHVYRHARYERRIDYRADPPTPDLPPDDAVWLAEHLRARGLRD